MKLSIEVLRETVGNLSNDHKSSENIIKRINLRPFKLYCIYLDQLNLSNVGDLSQSWIRLYPGSKRERKICCWMFMSYIKRCIRRFRVVLVQWTSKKLTKKHDACAEHSFAHKTIWCFCCGPHCGYLSSLVPDGYHSKGCHGYLLRLFVAPLVCPGKTCSRLQDNPFLQIMAHIFMCLSFTRHPYYMTAWNRLVQAPSPNPSIGHGFDTWKCICCRLICFLGQSVFNLGQFVPDQVNQMI